MSKPWGDDCVRAWAIQRLAWLTGLDWPGHALEAALALTPEDERGFDEPLLLDPGVGPMAWQMAEELCGPHVAAWVKSFWTNTRPAEPDAPEAGTLRTALLSRALVKNGEESERHVTPNLQESDVMLDYVALKDTPANRAYAERNRCVALMARMALAMGYRAGRGLHLSTDTSWEPDWRNIVFIDLPTGQVSWHFHDSEVALLDGLPEYPGGWDGHTTEQKYERVDAALSRGGGKECATSRPATGILNG